ncbi:hypothetical protein [Spirillospora sp. NPDC047279]|uniref:hypothetical protein n=1 Tax=Spirillospora sp. NPDC047279 TaxID=3155478 RepID=UPI0033E7580A
MPIHITETRMTLTTNGAVTAEAARVDGAWQVTTWPHPLDYNRAITALTLAERLANGHPETDPFVISWREELTHG